MSFSCVIFYQSEKYRYPLQSRRQIFEEEIVLGLKLRISFILLCVSVCVVNSKVAIYSNKLVLANVI